MIKEILFGMAGSAAVLAIDIFAVQWSDNSNGTRAVVALVVFALAFFAAKLLPSPVNLKRTVLSDNEIGGTMSVDAKDISASGAEKLLSSNKTGGDFNIKADKISS